MTKTTTDPVEPKGSRAKGPRPTPVPVDPRKAKRRTAKLARKRNR